MEKYININTIIEDSIYDIFKNSIICPLCNNILIDPMMCMKCQNAYCKKCIDDWNKNNEKCPKGCEAPNYSKSIGKNDILSKLKFRCVGCGEEIEYDNAEKHHESCCPGVNFDNSTKIPRLKRLNSTQTNKLKKEGKEMTYITSN